MLALVTKAHPSILRMRDEVGPLIGRLITPRDYGLGPSSDYPWAADNDAFNGFDAGRFCTMLGAIASSAGCLFVTAPDEVGDARLTRQRFEAYQPVITDCDLPVAYALQDGIEDVGVPWSEADAIFIGGTTAFKMGTVAARLAREAKERGKWVHMGRVNTLRRIEYAASIGCDSIDGTKWSRYTDTYLHQLNQLTFKQEQMA